MRIKFVITTIISCALLCGCGSEAAEPPASPVPAEPTITLPNGSALSMDTESLTLSASRSEDYPEIATVLSQLPELKSVCFEETLSADEFALFCRENPSVQFEASIDLAGVHFKSSDTRLELHGLDPATIESLAAILPGMRALESIDLGDEDTSPQLSLVDIGILQQCRSDVVFEYAFSLYGQTVRTTDTVLDLNHIEVEDEGAAVFEAMKYMPALELLDMDSCGVSNEAMAEIRDAYPGTKVVWRIWFADNYTVRTDVEMILASNPGVGGIMSIENTEPLKYCTQVRYLDLGHNPDLHTIEFVRYMPKLEVAILAMDNWSDCSPLAQCTELEYLEIQTTKVNDISALSGLTKLRHLNICYLFDLTDISPLYGLTQLERLWIGCLTPIPDEQVAKMQELAPDCVINTRTLDPTDDEWRYSRNGGLVPRYELLREQFGGYSNYAFAFPWNDPLYKQEA